MSSFEPAPFDVCGPLPRGVTVLEASAGTGKTFTIAGLAARYVAAGVPLERLLVVTFTRAATSELRDRVRERLVSAERGLERLRAGVAPDPADAVLATLATGSREAVGARRAHLARAVADFDAATIVTTHGFCQEVLGGLGIAGDLAPGVAFVEDLSDLTAEVVDDLYVRRFWNMEQVGIDLEQARRIAREAVGQPDAGIEPAAAASGPPDDPVAMRVRFAREVRCELKRRKHQRGVMTYDDLLTRLRDALIGESGPAVAQQLRARFGVVLVDEFQDTDPVQWEIMRRAFGEAGGNSTLVLIGDPKQAIYAFRGADVYAYLEAARTAGAEATLNVNRRSDQGLIDAYDALFGGAHLGHAGIRYRPVRAAEENRGPRLAGAPVSAPLRMRLVDRLTPGIGLWNGCAVVDDARDHIAADLAADVVRLLDSGAQAAGERVDPSHLAVLVRRNADASRIRDALAALDVPAVLNGAGSVFATHAAQEWLDLLRALERPASPPRARAVARSGFLGWETERLVDATEAEWEEVHRRLHGWAHLLRTRGVAALTERVTRAEGVPERLLAQVGGERRLTDLRHVAEALHAAALEEDMAAAALTGWLRRRIAEAGQESDEERSRRLESDAQAVQVLTIHRSKGLEFPIVYLPYLWHPTWIADDAVPAFHDPDDADRRKLSVGLQGRDYRAHRALELSEQRGEDLRLAYVGLTRARHQAVVWWAGTGAAKDGALTRLLCSRGEDGTVHDAGAGTPSDEAMWERCEALAAQAPGCVSVERARRPPGLGVTWSGALPSERELAVATFDRQLDLGWRRASYSSITADAYEARVGSEPEEDVVVVADEPEESDAAAEDSSGLPLAGMPAGVEIGTLVHGVLEAADFAAADLDAEFSGWVARGRARRRVAVGDPAAVVTGLRAALETPLGPLVDGRRLCDVARADRLDELNFELPLVGGDEPSGRLELSVLAAALRRHLPSDDPLAAYADRLEDHALGRDLRGYLTGSIDLVLRVRDGGGTSRFAIVDYKTNRLGPYGEPLRAQHYRPAVLAAEMQHSHYALQAILYTVALHRYLRWRVADYAPDRHLAGVLYLFLRGMVGAGTPTTDGTPDGVFAWRAPAALVTELSDVLDAGAPR